MIPLTRGYSVFKFTETERRRWWLPGAEKRLREE